MTEHYVTKQTNYRERRDPRRPFAARLVRATLYVLPESSRKPNRMAACEVCGKLTKTQVCGGCQQQATPGGTS